MLRKLSDFITIKHGFAFKGEDISGIDNGVMLVTPGNFAIGGGFQKHKCKFFVGKYPEEYVLNPRDLIVTMTDLSKEGDTLGYGALVPGDGYIYLHNQRIGLVEIHKEGLNKEYLYWFMRSRNYQRAVVSSCSGSVIKHTSPARITNIEIDLPELSTQTRIASILSALEFKIELNTAINNNLEQQAMALFKAWFVDFEHCQSEPFKDSEIGKIPSSYKVYHLKDFLPVITGKKNANVSSDKGKYPFFSCSQTIAWTDDYSFDGDAILVAGNGDFNVKFYKGKFEAYQRTYVLIPYEPKYTAWLYYAVKHNLHNITSAARGSVISFITKGNLEDFAFAAPEDLASASIIETFSSINKIIDANIRENYNLEAVRDTLLPKLMSGEIDVSKVDISDPGCLDKSLFNKETE